MKKIFLITCSIFCINSFADIVTYERGITGFEIHKQNNSVNVYTMTNCGGDECSSGVIFINCTSAPVVQCSNCTTEIGYPNFGSITITGDNCSQANQQAKHPH